MKKTKISKLIFKRKKGGGGSNWGAGFDYLFKDYWEDLDRLVEDNYYGRHNKELINHLFQEILKAFKKTVSEMKNLCGADIDKSGLKNWIKKGKNIENFSKAAKTLNDKVIFIDAVVQFLRETYSERPNRELKGIIANQSRKKVRGITKILLSEKDFSKIKKGDILVTDETDASFLPVMKKAKAIITDMGGLLCHAAITARELKKVCLTGVKIATSVLKDGDWVEINTEKGTVKIIGNLK